MRKAFLLEPTCRFLSAPPQPSLCPLPEEQGAEHTQSPLGAIVGSGGCWPEPPLTPSVFGSCGFSGGRTSGPASPRRMFTSPRQVRCRSLRAPPPVPTGPSPISAHSPGTPRTPQGSPEGLSQKLRVPWPLVL